MHPFLLVPLAATIIGSAIAAANLARAPSHPASRFSSAALALIALWGLMDFMSVTRSDAGAAISWLRAGGVVVLAIGPLCSLTLGALKPRQAPLMRRVAWVGFLSALPVAYFCLCTPLVMSRALPSLVTVWRYEPGPLFIWFALQAVAVPLATVAVILAGLRRTADGDTPHSDFILSLVVAAPLACSVVTEAVMPLSGIDSPRVGPLSMSLLGGLIWLSYFSGFDGAVSEAGLARRILERLPTGVALMEVDGRLRSVNRPLARWMGVEREDLIGRSVSSLILMPLPELLGLDEERETGLLLEGREPIPVAVSVNRIHDRQGGGLGYVVTCRDLREQADLESHLDSANQMATVGEMAAGIAHEVNNPVAYIQANLNLMRRHYQTLAEMLDAAETDPACTPEFVESGADRVEEALDGLSRISSIVREVRAFAHAGQGDRELIDVNEVLESALQLAALNQEDNGPIERSFAELPRIELSGQDLKQAFFGLAQWVLSRVGSGERVEVATTLVDERVHVVFEFRVGRSLSPADRGMRTATGSIQLVIARQIVEQQGGDLLVEDSDDGIVRICTVWPPESPDKWDATPDHASGRDPICSTVDSSSGPEAR